MGEGGGLEKIHSLGRYGYFLKLHIVYQNKGFSFIYQLQQFSGYLGRKEKGRWELSSNIILPWLLPSLFLTGYS